MFSNFKQGSMLTFCAFAIALAVGIFTTWPLANHAHEGIPALHRAEQGSPRVSVPGDHLQLMYFFQLTRDFITGETPWFHNLYEFNEGDDDARYEFDFYYMPFSLIFTAVELATGNPALAWNLTGFASLWAGVLGVMLLARRFTRDRWVILAATLASAAFPYRLITFLHGSPTGFGIAYVPFMLLGLDYAIRDKRILGGVLAGAAFFFAEWADLHVYFFLGLVAPFWCVFVYCYDDFSFDWRRILKIAKALLPVALFVLAAVFRIYLIRQGLEESVMAEGRTVREVATFAPSPNAYWSLNPDNPSSYVYMTFLIPIMILIGVLNAAWSLKKDFTAKRLYHFGMIMVLFAGVGCILLLGLGPRMPLPRPDRIWEVLVKLVPPYRMIRQPAKVLVLLPSLMAVLIALPFAQRAGSGNARTRGRGNWLYGILGLLLLFEVAWLIDPTISLLDREQRAYAAVADNARAHGEDPRALAVVLWPGDTHFASVHQYYGMKYRIRMINGYRPRVPTSYFDDVFMRFVSLNRGHASEEQLDALLEMGIRHIIVQEDAFPERVSPFSVGQTLRGFLQNDRVRLLEQDRAMWAFEIMETASDEHVTGLLWETVSPTYCWEAQWHVAEEVAVLAAPDAHGGHFVRSSRLDEIVRLPIWGINFEDGLRLSVRLRGSGELWAGIDIEGDMRENVFEVDSDEWIWLDIPFPSFDGFLQGLNFDLAAAEGEIDIDYAYLAMGYVPSDMQVGENLSIPAATLFRAGYTDLESGEVVFDPDLVPVGYVLYGPRLPLPIGRYRIRLLHESNSNEQIGAIGFRYPGLKHNPQTAAVMGSDAYTEIEYQQPDNLPMNIEFFYNRAATIAIQSLEIERME